MSIWEAAILGLLQGLTEFLPVSSSGHLVLGRHVLGLDPTPDVAFEIFVHFGTVLSIIVVYRKMLSTLIARTWFAVRHPGGIREQYQDDADFRTVVLIALTLVPTGIAYVLFKDPIEAAFADPRLASGMLIVTGILLLLTLVRKGPDGEVSALKSLVIGVAQSCAMIPGISRSGATICTGLYLNVEPERAANFSFLMLLPVVLGATALKLSDMLQAGGIDWLPIIVGTVVAFVSGIAAIRLVLDFVRRGRLQYFAWYCFMVGGLGLWLIP